jgi:hypothetical protein
LDYSIYSSVTCWMLFCHVSLPWWPLLRDCLLTDNGKFSWRVKVLYLCVRARFHFVCKSLSSWKLLTSCSMSPCSFGLSATN